MLKIGITGNIASGKSATENFLRGKAFKVLDTDEVAHDLLNNELVKKEICEAFMGYDLLEDNKISRAKLGKIVFPNKEAREVLEGILHPKIKIEVEKFFNEQKALDAKFAFVSAPLLFEAKFENLFDKIILIYSNDNLRLERLMKRNNLTLDYAKNRLDIQISQDKKISLADFVVYNNKDFADLYKNLEEVLKLL